MDLCRCVNWWAHEWLMVRKYGGRWPFYMYYERVIVLSLWLVRSIDRPVVFVPVLWISTHAPMGYAYKRHPYVFVYCSLSYLSNIYINGWQLFTLKAIDIHKHVVYLGKWKKICHILRKTKKASHRNGVKKFPDAFSVFFSHPPWSSD